MTGRRGFTLIEVMIALTILLVVIMLLASSTGRTVNIAATASAQETALQLAMDRVEQIRGDPRYNALEATYTATENVFPGLPGYVRTTRIVHVGGVGQANDYKKITVTVTGPGLAAPVARTMTVAAP